MVEWLDIHQFTSLCNCPGQSKVIFEQTHLVLYQGGGVSRAVDSRALGETIVSHASLAELLAQGGFQADSGPLADIFDRPDLGEARMIQSAQAVAGIGVLGDAVGRLLV